VSADRGPALARGALAAAAVALAVAATAPAGAQLILPGSTTTRPPPETTTTQPWPTDPGTTTTQPPPAIPDPPPPPPPSGDPVAPPPADAPPAAAGESPPASTPGAGGSAPGEPGTPAAPGAGQPTPAQPGQPGQPGAPAGPDGAAPSGPAPPGEVPADARRAMASIRRSRPNSTLRLLEGLQPLRTLGMSEAEVVAAGFGRFPVGGVATFTHDWFFPRFTPTFHLHEGTDIFARTGTPVRAPSDGMLRLGQGGSGGLAAYVYEPNGTYYYMAHLSAFVPGQKPGQQVTTGEIVGYVGDSGNAKGGSPHVHFEYHPAPTRTVTSGKGRSRTVTTVVRPVAVGSVLPPVDPKALLDQWLADALAAAPRLVASAEASHRAAAAAATPARAGSAAAPAATGVLPRAQLLWASSVSPSAGAVGLAEAAALDAASVFDWSEAARRHEEALAEQVAAQARAAAILEPLTPPGLRRAVPTGD
jgi:murein DD-endopeptidase MepM/ murein hydrolase activator NlpD